MLRSIQYIFCHAVVFIGHCLNCYGLAVSTWSFTHRHVEFVECVPKWSMRSHIQRFIKPPHRNCFEPIMKFIDENMQPNKRRRQKKEIFGRKSNGFHIDRSFTGFFVTTQLRRRFNTFSVWTPNTFKIQQKSEPQLTLWNCTHHTVTKTPLNCSVLNTTTNTCLRRRKLFFLTNYHM